jgi:hypothetical protein
MPRILIAVIAFVLGAGLMLLVDLEHWRDLRYVFSPVTEFADAGRYQGSQNPQGQLEGHGRMIWSNGARYEGDFLAGLFHGNGRLTYPHLSIYEGDFAKGYMHGQGTMVYEDGSRYEGAFMSGLFHGHGKLIQADGSVYEGSFDHNKISGMGKWIYADGSVYTGEVSEGLMHGKGELLQANGNKYTGDFLKGRMNGEGAFIDTTGAQYSGEYINDVFSGKGVVKDVDGGTQTGNFVGWQLHGQGIRTSKNGNQWQGEFKHGMLEGQGSYRGKNGEQYTGEFNFEQYHGKGRLVSAEGDVYEGEFEYGQKNGKGELTYKQPIDGISKIEGHWNSDRLVDGGDQLKIFSSEEIAAHAMDHHPAFLSDKLAHLPAGNPEVIELYSLVVAGYGEQEVFRRESRFIEDFLHDQYSHSHAFYLVNSQRNLDQHPLATLTSIRTALERIAAQMNKDQDILLLYVTSHGSKDKKISLQHNGVALVDIDSRWLAEQLDATGIKHRVVILSACYSGGFIDDLKGDQTLVITSAAANKKSFGCADDSLFTYFGKAYFKEALKPGVDIEQAFDSANELVSQWEAEKKYTPSEPQIYRNKRVLAQFRQWLAGQRQGSPSI